ncbi:hypothetical protein DFH06DRAFT_1426638 [Mycena polygramma]|nr:hypothetical protein DFH06DRAFT_1426638 [Mycena polygramma]
MLLCAMTARLLPPTCITAVAQGIHLFYSLGEGGSIVVGCIRIPLLGIWSDTGGKPRSPKPLGSAVYHRCRIVHTKRASALPRTPVSAISLRTSVLPLTSTWSSGVAAAAVIRRHRGPRCGWTDVDFEIEEKRGCGGRSGRGEIWSAIVLIIVKHPRRRPAHRRIRGDGVDVRRNVCAHTSLARWARRDVHVGVYTKLEVCSCFHPDFGLHISGKRMRWRRRRLLVPGPFATVTLMCRSSPTSWRDTSSGRTIDEASSTQTRRYD